mmetsp:Transcript_10532/g.15655  ORF Transcript_10532/g.15655 Transcript_10532/m.15655 type:complete len:210 (-) Transcript_10532:1316-1945(-)
MRLFRSNFNSFCARRGYIIPTLILSTRFIKSPNPSRASELLFTPLMSFPMRSSNLFFLTSCCKPCVPSRSVTASLITTSRESPFTLNRCAYNAQNPIDFSSATTIRGSVATPVKSFGRFPLQPTESELGYATSKAQITSVDKQSSMARWMGNLFMLFSAEDLGSFDRKYFTIQSSFLLSAAKIGKSSLELLASNPSGKASTRGCMIPRG